MKLALGIATVLAVALALALAPAVPASTGVTGWDGSNPFVCQLQNAGFGTAVPHPEADPYCVEFDKRHQNVDQLGVVDFLSNEPARVAAASPKCFYFQSDHWRGSVIQNDPQTKTYEWDGHYFFDKARGMGGAWVTNLSFGGQTADPSKIPGMPAGYAPFLGPGTGGLILLNDIPVDPACAARAQADPGAIYAGQGSNAGDGGGGGQASACIHPRGRRVRRSLGPIRLGEREAGVRAALGVPIDVRSGYLRYCVSGGGAYLVGEHRSGNGPVAGPGADDRTAVLMTTSPAYRLRGTAVGWSVRAFRRRCPHATPVARLRGGRVWRVKLGRRASLLVDIRGGRVRWLALYDRRSVQGHAALIALMRRAAP